MSAGSRASAGLAVRSVLWAVLLPGTVTGYVPWRYFGLARVRLDSRNPLHGLGIVCIGIGAILLGTCIREFARRGRGTLSPVEPPRELVVQGLYRYVRNPMYLSVCLILLGEFFLIRSRSFLLYALSFFLVVNVFVMGYEEPDLRRRFDGSYALYCRRVGRWLPRIRADRS